MTMEQRVSVITLGVADMDRARAFYSGVLQWRPFMDNNEAVAYDLGGLVLMLFSHEGMAHDTARPAPPPPPGGYQGFALAHNVGSRDKVDRLLERIGEAGQPILKPAHETFWGGYAGYFADPDGHAWEIAHNPHWTINPDGRLALPPTPGN